MPELHLPPLSRPPQDQISLPADFDWLAGTPARFEVRRSSWQLTDWSLASRQEPAYTPPASPYRSWKQYYPPDMAGINNAQQYSAHFYGSQISNSGVGELSKDRHAIHPYLQLPSTITSSKGSLAEFAAEITCLFWFESSTTLAQIEALDFSSLATGLAPEAQPAISYLKWVTTILSTTQVTQNVILLALLFVYRLKRQNPSVKGKPGSEFRLLTVALMLGNKFLDDNTYTNKTWAEVSGISVQEIHVMEVEFLSHMKYDLYTSKETWEQWHRQLGTFHKYFDRATRLQQAGQRTLTFRPHILKVPLSLPSPPNSNFPSPLYASQTPEQGTPYSSSTIPGSSYMLPSHLSANNTLPELDRGRSNGRKRSFDDILQEPPPKRQLSNSTLPSSGEAWQSATIPTLPSLPIPHLPTPVSQSGSIYGSNATYTPTSIGRNTPNVALPPLSWSHTHASQPPPTLPHLHNQASMGSSYDWSVRQQTPLAPLSRNPSPGTSDYPSTRSHTLSQNRNSPSYFLNQRTSPYKPVRGIRTLLDAPSSGQMQQAEQPLQHAQMHWHPIGKLANPPRTGRVPYLHRDAWPQTHQLDQWPTLYPNNSSY